jgi:hypothetical protein
MTVAAATGDAGQLGMAAGFKGCVISLLIDRPGDFRRTDLFQGNGFGGDRVRGDVLGGDRLWGSLSLGFRHCLGLMVTPGDGPSARPLRGADFSGRDLHPSFQHSVSQR